LGQMKLCRYGLHERTPENLTPHGACRPCIDMQKRGEPRPPSRSERFRQELRRRYPCSAYPNSAVAEIAREIGLNLSAAARLAREMNYERLEKPRVKYLCICGKEMEREGSVCRKCRWIEARCAQCAKLTEIRVSILTIRASRGAQHFFCSQKCQGKWKQQQPCKRGHERKSGPSKRYCPTCLKANRTNRQPQPSPAPRPSAP